MMVNTDRKIDKNSIAIKNTAIKSNEQQHHKQGQLSNQMEGTHEVDGESLAVDFGYDREGNQRNCECHEGVPALLTQKQTHNEACHQLGKILQGKVCRIESYGAFVDLENGKTQFVHISQLTLTAGANVKDILRLEQLVFVLPVNCKCGSIKLSMRLVNQDTGELRLDDNSTAEDVEMAPQLSDKRGSEHNLKNKMLTIAVEEESSQDISPLATPAIPQHHVQGSRNLSLFSDSIVEEKTYIFEEEDNLFSVRDHVLSSVDVTKKRKIQDVPALATFEILSDDLAYFNVGDGSSLIARSPSCFDEGFKSSNVDECSQSSGSGKDSDVSVSDKDSESSESDKDSDLPDPDEQSKASNLDEYNESWEAGVGMWMDTDLALLQRKDEAQHSQQTFTTDQMMTKVAGTLSYDISLLAASTISQQHNQVLKSPEITTSNALEENLSTASSNVPLLMDQAESTLSKTEDTLDSATQDESTLVASPSGRRDSLAYFNKGSSSSLMALRLSSFNQGTQSSNTGEGSEPSDSDKDSEASASDEDDKSSDSDDDSEASNSIGESESSESDDDSEASETGEGWASSDWNMVHELDEIQNDQLRSMDQIVTAVLERDSCQAMTATTALANSQDNSQRSRSPTPFTGSTAVDALCHVGDSESLPIGIEERFSAQQKSESSSFKDESGSNSGTQRVSTPTRTLPLVGVDRLLYFDEDSSSPIGRDGLSSSNSAPMFCNEDEESESDDDDDSKSSASLEDVISSDEESEASHSVGGSESSDSDKDSDSPDSDDDVKLSNPGEHHKLWEAGEGIWIEDYTNAIQQQIETQDDMSFRNHISTTLDANESDKSSDSETSPSDEISVSSDSDKDNVLSDAVKDSELSDSDKDSDSPHEESSVTQRVWIDADTNTSLHQNEACESQQSSMNHMFLIASSRTHKGRQFSGSEKASRSPDSDEGSKSSESDEKSEMSDSDEGNASSDLDRDSPLSDSDSEESSGSKDLSDSSDSDDKSESSKVGGGAWMNTGEHTILREDTMHNGHRSFRNQTLIVTASNSEDDNKSSTSDADSDSSVEDSESSDSDGSSSLSDSDNGSNSSDSDVDSDVLESDEESDLFESDEDSESLDSDDDSEVSDSDKDITPDVFDSCGTSGAIALPLANESLRRDRSSTAFSEAAIVDQFPIASQLSQLSPSVSPSDSIATVSSSGLLPALSGSDHDENSSSTLLSLLMLSSVSSSSSSMPSSPSASSSSSFDNDDSSASSLDSGSESSEDSSNREDDSSGSSSCSSSFSNSRGSSSSSEDSESDSSSGLSSTVTTESGMTESSIGSERMVCSHIEFTVSPPLMSTLMATTAIHRCNEQFGLYAWRSMVVENIAGRMVVRVRNIFAVPSSSMLINKYGLFSPSVIVLGLAAFNETRQDSDTWWESRSSSSYSGF